MTLSLKTDVNVPTKSNEEAKKLEKNLFFVGILKAIEEKCRTGSGSVSQWYRSADPDPDPYQNVTVLQHCIGTLLEF
jgi:hypothetical protein